MKNPKLGLFGVLGLAEKEKVKPMFTQIQARPFNLYFSVGYFILQPTPSKQIHPEPCLAVRSAVRQKLIGDCGKSAMEDEDGNDPWKTHRSTG